ncbi:spermatogenesis-associated protein 21 isoform X4 [Monodelphis domestica]|uniref:spermatogenesis-associated protein 21 isoform X4 n=1 Tax=Monodelphis domestica TaxID=13616 RepID=UPI0024E1A566|nr:spermatogenesis-associated protein 21 isoform X4 [Monodelphis domestica]
MWGKEIGAPLRAQMGEGRTTKGRGKNLRAQLAWCEETQVQRLARSQTFVPAQGQQLAELEGVLELPITTGRRNVNYSRERIPKVTSGLNQGRYLWLDSIGGSGAVREQAGVKSHTEKHWDLFQAREREAGAGGRGRLTTLAPGGPEQTPRQGEEAEKGPLNDRAKERRPRSGAEAGKEAFRSEKDRAEYISPSTSASVPTTMTIQGLEAKIQTRSEKSAKGYHDNQMNLPSPDLHASGNQQGLEHGFKKTRGGSSGVKSGVGNTGPSEEEQGLGPGYKKTRGGSLGLKSGGESAVPNGEEQGLGPGYKKTRGGSTGLKSGGESAGLSGEEQGLGSGYKKTRGGDSGLKSGVESAGLSGEEQGLGHGLKKTRGGGSSVKSGGESAGLSGEEQGQGHGLKKTRGGGSSVKSGGESAGLSGEEQGLGLGYKKTRGGGSSVKSGGENSGPIGEEQELSPAFWKTKFEGLALRSDMKSPGPHREQQQKPEDHPFPDQQAVDKGELMEKEELSDPDSMGQSGRHSSQEVHDPPIIWVPMQKVEADSEQFEDNTPDQSFQLRSQDEERSPLPTPSSMDGPSSSSTSTLLSPTPIQPKVREKVPKAQLVPSPAVPPIHHSRKKIQPEKKDREDESDEDWKASPLTLVPTSSEKNWKKTELHRNLDRPHSKIRPTELSSAPSLPEGLPKRSDYRGWGPSSSVSPQPEQTRQTRLGVLENLKHDSVPMTASAIERLESSTRPLSSHIYKRDSDSIPVVSTFKDWKDEFLTQKQEEAFREYFKFFCDAGEIDIHSLKNILSIVGISRTSAEMVEALMSADVNCDGHVDFKDFLTVLTDTQRFCRSVEQHTNPSSNGRNPHTLLFEVLSQLIEMLALPENFMEEITNYYQKKMKGMSRYKESPITASRQPHPHKRTFARTSDVSPHEQKVINIVDRIKRQNHSTFLQSPYAIQGANHSLCPRLDRKITRRKQGSHVILEEYKPIDLTTDFRNFFQMGPKGVRDLNPTLRKWLTSMSSRTH